jgi:hypothetical protein
MHMQMKAEGPGQVHALLWDLILGGLYSGT